MKQFYTLFALFISFSGLAQLNMDSVGHVDYSILHGTNLNDVWGYVDEVGNEYALVGAEDGTGIVDVTNPATPNEVFWVPGINSVWRDLKTFGDYAYVTTEASSGLLIIDMSPLPGSTALSTAMYNGPLGQEWESAHNIYVDSLGYAYIFGANRGNSGVIILDVFTDPMNPIEVGVFDDWYVHDGFVLGDTMYLAHISDGFISIVDVTDRANPVLLGTKTTPSNFAHNIWPSDDGQYVFTTDELPFSYLAAYDVSDPANIVELDRIQSTPGVGTIPHNTHVLGDYIVTSHYTDGVVVHDVTYPYNMVEVGDYDTHPDQNTTYDGCWGTYPYLPSGLVLATDRSEGLFLLNPTYTKAAYLEGIVTDAVTTSPVDLVSIEIATDEQTESTDAVGFYATGIAAGGTYDVTYSKVGYYPQTISVTLTNDVIAIQDVQLVPIPPYSLTVTVLESGTNNPITGAEIRLDASLLSHTGSTNGIGEENFTLFYEESYDVIVGHWGHVTTCDVQFIDNSTGSITVFLDKGYYDDFTFDFGWSASGSASTGLWQRGEPFGTSNNSAPSEDLEFDCGDFAYVTGNAPTDDPDADDVDGGDVLLVSPIMDLTSYGNPYVNYARWFYTQFGPSDPDDTLRVLISNGTNVVQIDAIGEDPPTFATWQYQNIRLLDYITLTSTMQIFFRTSDHDPNVNITEAAIDGFFIGESAVGIEEPNFTQLSVYPNPTEGLITVDHLLEETSYSLLNGRGQIVMQGELTTSQASIDLQELESGIYFLHLSDQIVKIFKTK